jgi:mRNA interferase MazF
MATYERWDVVAVPFPFVDRSGQKRRPAVVVSGSLLAEVHGLYWVAMVTSADNPRWQHDIVCSDLSRAGLPKPSIIRLAKLATLDESRIVRKLGRLARADVEAAQQAFEAYAS